MGKGYNNFMSKKAFHPGSYANQKRIQEAEAKAEAKRKHDEETLAQYQKEQELFQQKSLVSKESKDKLSLSFMYDAPPGTSQQEAKDEATNPSLKWKGEKEAVIKKRVKGDDDTDSDDEPKIVLEWKRDESKTKKPPPPTHIQPSNSKKQQQQLLAKRVKKET